MVQKNFSFCQREEVIGWKLPSVQVRFEFHTGVSKLKFGLENGRFRRVMDVIT